jgi:hypothetical protein
MPVGRKKRLTKRNVLALNKARKVLIKQAAGQKEVHWADVIKRARVPKCTSTTAKKALEDCGLPIAWRTPRQKPVRSAPVRRARVKHCKTWAKKGTSYFTKEIDLYMDNKKFAIPTAPGAVAHLKMGKVRGHLRLRSEGVSPGFTKPNNRRHRINPGASASVCAHPQFNRLILHLIYDELQWNQSSKEVEHPPRRRKIASSIGW